VRLRAGDADRAARFFGALVGAKTERRSIGAHIEQRIVESSPVIEPPIVAIFTDDQSAPPARLCFSTQDPEAAFARALALGGAGADMSDVRDNQGMPLAVQASVAMPTLNQAVTGALGVVIVLVSDTAKAREFHHQLFGLDFYKVGSGDFWWVSKGPSLGVFTDMHETAGSETPHTEAGPTILALFCVGDLDQAMGKVLELGGSIVRRETMGPYHVCDCRDDQGMRFGLWWDPSKNTSGDARDESEKL
jgi:predicted enzyme related to lactoylglutathione lyase